VGGARGDRELAAPAATLARKAFDEAAPPGALAGVRVVDLSRLVAGNTLTKMLADHGADVLKVEPPTGDTLRAGRVAGVETSWETWCRNKRSLCLDLRRGEAVEVVRNLAAGAEIFVESFRPGVLEEMRLGPETLLAQNPRLVVVRVSGWGQTGPLRDRPGFGTLAEGHSGFAAMNGFADREPVLPPMFLADAMAGLHGASAALAALRHAERTGEGQVIDLSLFEPLFAALEPQMANHRLTSQVKPRTGSRSTNTAPRNAHRTSDGGWMGLFTSTQAMFERLVRSIGRADLLADPRFRTNPDRLRHVAALDAVVAEAIGSMTQAEALEKFGRDGVTVGPILDAEGLSRDAYLAGREALVELPDAEMPGGWLPTHGEVPRMSRTPTTARRRAPVLGEHSREILEPLLGAAEYARLRGAGIILEGPVP